MLLVLPTSTLDQVYLPCHIYIYSCFLKMACAWVLSEFILINKIRKVQRQFGLGVKNVIHCLHTNHETVILIRNLILPAPESAPRPNILCLQCRKNLCETAVSLEGRSGISMGEFAVVDWDDFVIGEEQRSVDGALDGVGYERGFCDGFHGGFGDFKHEGPVGTLLGVGGVGFGAVGELECGETSWGCGLIVRGVIWEDCSSIEGTIWFREVELL